MNPALLLVAIGLALLAGTPVRATLRVVPETRATETRPAEPKPSETRPGDARPAEGRPAADRPADLRPPDARPVDARPADVRPAETRPAEARPAAAPRELAAPPARSDRPAPRDTAGGQRARPGTASSSDCSDDLMNLSLGIDEPGKDRPKSNQCK